MRRPAPTDSRVCHSTHLHRHLTPWRWTPSLLAPYLAIAFSLCGLPLCTPAILRADDQQSSYFEQRVEPILKQRCYGCHSHAAQQMEGGLTLDWRTGWEQGGGRGAAIVPHDPDNSLLIQAVQHALPDLLMPDEKLPADEIAVLIEWVRQGAPDPRVTQPDDAAKADWWSLQPLVRPALPASDTPNPIDAFIHDGLSGAGLSPSPYADPLVQVRRLYLDLIGLPPTPAEVAAFVNDRRPEAWSELVDRLLESPRYGEHWARHWLDTIHFADSHGFEHDVFRPHAWRFRDYVIDRLNRDVPWDRFIREQLAADAFYPEETSLTAALGYLGAGTYDASAAATAPKSFEYLDRDDLVTQTLGAFVSTTANCARCHAHKFDPITQADYFSLQAVFAGIGKGDIPFDANPQVGAQRKRWQDLRLAADQHNAALLLTPEHLELLAEWEHSRGQDTAWTPLPADLFVSAGGATVRRLEDQSYLVTGALPAVETLTLSGVPPLKRVTALRLDVLADPSLPAGGPGRAPNGNLHLSEVVVQHFAHNATEGAAIALTGASADFDQDGWTIQHALDGNPATAWGIYPAVGTNHHAVLTLAQPLEVTPNSRLVVQLKQLHGGSHTIGRFKLSISDAHPASVMALSATAAAVLTVPPEQRTPEQTTLLAATVLKVRAEEELRRLPPPDTIYAAASSATNERGVVVITEPRPIHILKRGDLNQPLEEVGPGALSAITELPARFEIPSGAPESARRAALADWLADDRNPLTWRSVANRFWHYHFGRGLCDTPSDLGRMGGLPSHPDLLDWLACEMRDRKSLKHLHRLICTSQTYRRASSATSQQLARDPDNRLLARMNRQRLTADAYRDAVLSVSGKLDLTMGGPGVQHFSTSPGPQATPVLDYDALDWDQPGWSRRSIYRVVWRGIPDPMMDALDFPDLGLSAPSRGTSISPLQSLVLLNNRFVLHFAQHLARAAEADSQQPTHGPASSEPASSVAASVRAAVRRVWLREPSREELSALTELAQQHGLPAVCRLLLNSNEFLFVE